MPINNVACTTRYRMRYAPNRKRTARWCEILFLIAEKPLLQCDKLYTFEQGRPSTATSVLRLQKGPRSDATSNFYPRQGSPSTTTSLLQLRKGSRSTATSLLPKKRPRHNRRLGWQLSYMERIFISYSLPWWAGWDWSYLQRSRCSGCRLRSYSKPAIEKVVNENFMVLSYPITALTMAPNSRRTAKDSRYNK